MLTDVFAECVRKLEPGGRIAVNGQPRPWAVSKLVGRCDRISNTTRAATSGTHLAEGRRRQRFMFRAPIQYRDISERVIVASKGRFDRAALRSSN
jgi:site-specific DNA-methyltransferase (adenine-specific)